MRKLAIAIVLVLIIVIGVVVWQVIRSQPPSGSCPATFAPIASAAVWMDNTDPYTCPPGYASVTNTGCVLPLNLAAQACATDVACTGYLIPFIPIPWGSQYNVGSAQLISKPPVSDSAWPGTVLYAKS